MRRLLVVLVCLLALPAVAGAATVRVDVRAVSDRDGTYREGTVRLEAAPGAADDVTVTREGFAAVVVRDTAGAVPGAGCVAQEPTAVRCTAQTIGGVTADLGDGADRFRSPGGEVRVLAGDGDDDVELAAGATFAGQDQGSPGLDGGAGDDRLVSAVPTTFTGGPGADLMQGDGRGELDFRDHDEGVTVDLASGEAGAAGEGDRVSGMRAVLGGAGADVLRGTDGDDDLQGGPGDDLLDGGAGTDLLEGDAGADGLTGGPGNDRLAGGGDPRLPTLPGVVDTLDGGPGEDVLSGSPGTDHIDGGPDGDVVEGHGGPDLITAADASVDLVGCGTRGRSGAATLDRRDLVRHCASIARDGAPRPEVLFAAPSDEDRPGVVRVGVGCPQDLRGGCAVRVQLRQGARVTARRTLSVPPGTSRLVRPTLPHFRPKGCAVTVVGVVVLGRDGAGGPVRSSSVARVGALGARGVDCRLPTLVNAGEGGGW